MKMSATKTFPDKTILCSSKKMVLVSKRIFYHLIVSKKCRLPFLFKCCEYYLCHVDENKGMSLNIYENKQRPLSS